MIYHTSTITMHDGVEIYIHTWMPEHSPPTKSFFLVHGSVEHAKRYEEFAKILVAKGYVVIAPDYRGHGLTGKSTNSFGHIGNKDGFNKIVDDLKETLVHFSEFYGDLPLTIFGHSFGSFLVRKLVSDLDLQACNVIISGTSYGKLHELKGGVILSKTLSKFISKDIPNQKYSNFFWGVLNSKVKNKKGTLDYLTRDEVEIEKFIDDDLCGSPISIEFGTQMAKANNELRKDKYYKKTSNKIRLMLISGTDDPLSNKGKDIDKIALKYKKFGTENITIKLYKDARHELLNELNKEEVTNDIINWLEQ